MSHRIAVVGASGKTGRAVTAALTDRGAEPVGVGRAQWDTLPDTLIGCAAVHVIAPNLHPDEPGFVGDVLAAARLAGVMRVVYHSVASPYAPDMPHHLAKAWSEDAIRRSGLDWTILQPCAYVQNFVPALAAAARDDDLVVPYAVDQPFGLVDLIDVGEATATVLLDDAHVGATYELGGPALVTVADVAAAASRVLGRPVRARRTPPQEWVATTGADLDPRERDLLVAMFCYYDRRGLPAGGLVLRALLGREPNRVIDVLKRELDAARAG
ncbi:SDR family oxidoreductase [Nocardioides pacificus]